jgi:hypothetical protein
VSEDDNLWKSCCSGMWPFLQILINFKEVVDVGIHQVVVYI